MWIQPLAVASDLRLCLSMISAGILEMCVFMCLNLDMLGAPQHNFLRSKALIRASGVDMVLLIRILVVRLAVWVEVGPEK
jgi:hypothetical protein